MDYKGQQLSEWIYYFLTISFGVAAWVYGFIHEDFGLTVQGWAVGLGLALIMCIPDWPIFNRAPVQWLDNLVGAPAVKKSSSSKGGAKSSAKK